MRYCGLLFVLIVLFFSFAAKADIIGTVDMQYVGYGANSSLTLWGGGNYELDTRGGVHMFEKTGSTGQGDLIDNGLIAGFCMDLAEWRSNDELTYNVLNPSDGPISYSFLGGAMGSEKADYLSELWGRYYDESWFGTGDHSSDENRYAEAFGSAVWEIIYEALPGSAADWDVTRDGTSGELGFRAEGLDSLTANRWLHSLNGYGPKANLVALSYCGAQDFLVESPIPEPATVALLGFGLLFICRRAKVRHSK